MNELGTKLLAKMLEKNSETEFRIKTGIEMYRKGFGRIWLQEETGDNEFRDHFRPHHTELAGGDSNSERTMGYPCRDKAEIHLEQTGHEYNFGSNMFMHTCFPDKEHNDEFDKVFAENFNLGVIPFYWKDLEPEDGKLRFAKDSPPIYRRPAPDLCVEYCKKNNIRMKGHPLCWSQWQPDYLPEDRRALLRRLERRFAEIAERYGNDIFIFDVLNETIASARWPNMPYAGEIDEKAFRLGEKYFPGAQLVLNDDDHWWEYNGEYSWFLLQVKYLMSKGIKPGGLGFQMHFFPHYLESDYKHFLDPANLLRMLDLYQKLDVPCCLTEISAMARKDMLGDDNLEFQRILVENLYRTWFSHPATDGIIWWNPVDGTAAGAPLGTLLSENSFCAGLFNYDMTHKPAGKAVYDLIHKEWHSSIDTTYELYGDNRFHGFYGDYDVTIKMAKGTWKTKLTLSKFRGPDFVIRLDDAHRIK